MSRLDEALRRAGHTAAAAETPTAAGLQTPAEADDLLALGYEQFPVETQASSPPRILSPKSRLSRTSELKVRAIRRFPNETSIAVPVSQLRKR